MGPVSKIYKSSVEDSAEQPLSALELSSDSSQGDLPVKVDSLLGHLDLLELEFELELLPELNGNVKIITS
ncbi:hypothetical protein SAMN05660706_12032 [Desulfoscipio geothermicus DSM 3669]|uniref:Uncharacterized protein n=1 Tax=Desulfoscipio geothermicus DSM 3669 TaxID=1121426 RepID=A0A1I6DX54_9FIRM|nr:hypothetical protein SAMN05660706_12032 [Desulfoscipio geothermicus DSM 3669]